MRTNLATIRKRIPLNLKENGTDVILTWKEVTGGTIDPVTGSIKGGVEETKTQTVKAFIHTAEGRTVLRQHTEIEEGDVLADFASDAPLDGKNGLTFTIDGQVYEQKQVGEKLTKTWDVVMNGKRLFRTVLLKKRR